MATLGRPLCSLESAVSVRCVGISRAQHDHEWGSATRMSALRCRQGESIPDLWHPLLCHIGSIVFLARNVGDPALPGTPPPSW
jgi:hypothetical protein